MAKSPAAGGGSSVTEATTLIFPKKSAWEEAREAKRTASKRSKSANGTWSTTLTRLVEDDHMDRRAARMVLALDAIEDDSDLHVTVFHLIDGLKKLGILKRAMAQEELFDDHKIDDASLKGSATAGAKGAKSKKGSGATGTDLTNVTQIGDAARQVAEKAGADLGR
jgi:hypothetical protein